MTYAPTQASITQHQSPPWFNNAKLGIFVHWGLYSVPAWAPLAGELGKVVEEKGWAYWFANNPYAEWYMNSLGIPDSATHRHHVQTYGQNFAYRDFATVFNQQVANWDPDQWATLFAQVGARYVVLTTKHHDGYLLWPSHTPNPFIQGYHAPRDLVGELTAAVRRQGMTMGLYYSGGLDWTFNNTVIQDRADFQHAIPQTQAYVNYANTHWRELIDRYQATVLWNDIAYPANTDLNELFAYFYNAIPDGVVNNRFRQHFDTRGGNTISDVHFDFDTPEYASFAQIRSRKWESCRGVGFSFGYNQLEGPAHYLTETDLIHSFVDIVSKNGNLLLNIGPMADGTIPPIQRDRLLALGNWLAVNGEAIYDTEPWHVADSTTDGGIPVRFTQKPGALYATLLGTPTESSFILKGVQLDPAATAHLLGRAGALTWQPQVDGIVLHLAQPLPPAVAHSFKLTPSPEAIKEV